MSHDPEQLAAAYLAVLRPRARRRFEEHLLACEPCWQEISLAHRGRQLAETARDIAPAPLRDDIHAAVQAAATPPSAGPRPFWRTAAAAATGLAVLAGAAILMRPWPHAGPAASDARPALIAAAVASYRASRLPGTALPAGPAPDLTPLHLRLAGAAAGRLDGVPVTMFAYRSPSGTRLAIMASIRPFPEATNARELGGTQDAWTMRAGGVTVLCAQGTHAMLVLGADAALVRQAGALLNAI